MSDTTPQRERNARIVERRLEGLTLAAIAELHGLKVPRVSQILRAHERRHGVRLVRMNPGHVVEVQYNGSYAQTA